MLQCWDIQPENRPTFSNIVSPLSQSLEAMAGYMDIGAFGETIKQPKEVYMLKEKDQSQCDDYKSQEVVVGTSHEETPV